MRITDQAMRLVSSAALGLLVATHASMSAIATPSGSGSPVPKWVRQESAAACGPPAPPPIEKGMGICPAH